jgi:hypothetical protein
MGFAVSIASLAHQFCARLSRATKANLLLRRLVEGEHCLQQAPAYCNEPEAEPFDVQPGKVWDKLTVFSSRHSKL